MADDLGDLLDEVERKFCSPKTTPTTTAVSKATVSTENPHGNCKTAPSLSSHSAVSSVPVLPEDDDLEQIISEIIGDESYPSKNSIWSKGSTGASGSPGRRCFPVLLAGTSTVQGLTDSHTRRACDRLYCTSCDFHVITFDDYVWHGRCDYLFFRNCMPDRDKLRKNLVRRKGCRAYACQCLWRSVTGVEELGRDGGKGEGGGGRGEKGEERRRRGRGEKVGAETCPPLSSLKWVCRRHFTD